MTRLVYEPVVSVDGFAAAPDGDIGWQCSESFELMTPDQLRSLEQAGAILLGANTYRMSVGHWPTADAEAQPVAEPINRLPKHVSAALSLVEMRSYPGGHTVLEYDLLR